jgi:hypothetical protein
VGHAKWTILPRQESEPFRNVDVAALRAILRVKNYVLARIATHLRYSHAEQQRERHRRENRKTHAHKSLLCKLKI